MKADSIVAIDFHLLIHARYSLKTNKYSVDKLFSFVLHRLSIFYM